MMFDRYEMVLPDFIRDDVLIRWFRRPVVDILIVVDSSLSFTSAFGVGKVIDVIRENVDNYVRLNVDLARLGQQDPSLSVNDSPGNHEEKYLNYRFSSQHNGSRVIDRYDEIWCFGFAPGNNGSSDVNNIWNILCLTNRP